MQATEPDIDLATTDLGPLAWVLDELRKSLEAASAALRRFVRDTGLARGTDMASVDTGQLRIARQQLHQAVGALEMVGLAAPAQVLRSMEAAVQKFTEKPEICDEAAATQVDRAGVALTEYLEGVLMGKTASAVGLFAQYSQTQRLAGADRNHPADLWAMPWRWNDVSAPAGAQALAYGPVVRARMDHAVLSLVKSGHVAAASELVGISLGLAQAQEARQPRIFWRVCAGFFEALALGLLKLDLHQKRAASRVLMQYALLAKGELGVSDRLVHDLVFFCAQAVPAPDAQAPSLLAVRQAWELGRFPPVDYETVHFGKFDPAVLAQARKRVAIAKETWALLAGGDVHKLKLASDQFNLVGESLARLHPESAPLAQALTQVLDTIVKTARPPDAEVSMEVATAVLYLEAALEDLDSAGAQLADRSGRLAQRLQAVRAGAKAEPLEAWMEELDRKVSDRQTMGSVVGELRSTMAELEKLLDQYFRNLQDKSPLREAPNHLMQMRGVLSVLGLDQAAQAVQHMRETVDEIIDTEIDPQRSGSAGTFERLGNNLGALGFLIDMLNYQPTLAKKLFVYDEASGELRPLMGRAAPAARELPAAPASVPVAQPTPPEPAPVAVPAPVQSNDEDDEQELKGIFLDEAREVVQSGLTAVDVLSADPSDTAQLTSLRRAFHTLKGSSRMVGLSDFGDAAWSLEQVLNTWLADQKPAGEDLRSLASEAMRGFGRWIEDVASGSDAGWKVSMFRGPADALRTEGRLIPFEWPQGTQAPAPGQAAAPQEPPVFDLDFSDEAGTEASTAQEPQTSEASDELSADFDFELPVVPGADQPPPLQLPAEIDGIDLPSLAQIAQPQPEPEPDAAVDVSEDDDQIKVIGDLRIGIPLYNVYLNEADEWSRRLVTEVDEWALELNRPVLDSTVALAHSLAGSSATVGFMTLSEIARALEAALQQTQPLAWGTPQHGKAFVEAAEEIRRLLHQFAAGFLKDANPAAISALLALKDLDIPKRGEAPDAQVDDQPLPTPAPVAANVIALRAFAPAAVTSAQSDAPSISRREGELPAAHDDIDFADAIDPDLFQIFEEEAAELMPQIGSALRQWVARPDNRSARDEVLRGLHTLKGSARLAGALRLGELAHRMESQIESLGSQTLPSAEIEPLLYLLDGMQGNFDKLRLPAPAQAVDTEALQPPSQPEAAGQDAGTDTEQPARALLARPVTTHLAPARAAANQAVRVRSQLLDRLVAQAGEVMMTRTRLEAELRQLRSSLSDLDGNLERLRGQLRDIELQAETQMQSRMAQAKDSAAGFDPLEFDRFTRVQELTRMMAESVNDVATVQRNLERTVEATEDDLVAQARQTRELQRDLLRTRMVEFEGIADRLYRVIRMAAKETGKQVKLDIHGGSIEMDRGVLDRLTPAFEHLLRNCVAHGIETPAARAAAGKDATGSILIELRHDGNDVSVEFHDDGAGLDLARIREKASQQGLIAPGQELGDQDTANLIFLPGFTTATEVTELSGRGIGMDVVRAQINAVGGRIELSSAAGQGTRFKLVLPLTTAVTQVVMIRCGKFSFGVPANLIEVVRRVPAKDVQQAYNSGLYAMGEESIAFFWSGALLQSSACSLEPQTKTLPVVVLRSAAQRVAMHVDEVLGNQEVVVKNLGPQLSRLPGLVGMTVLASGAVVLIYNPVALSTVYGEQARRMSADKAQPEMLERAGETPPEAPPQIPLVLVVDDSITVRRVTQRLLQREGYRVALANDGLHALERLAEEKPAVVLSDIEMPRMDGFDLVRHIRNDARLKDLPVVMITSRIAQKHRDLARELGVDHYLGKPYSEEEMLSLVKHYSAASASTSA